jgi:Rrf2 family protein
MRITSSVEYATRLIMALGQRYREDAVTSEKLSTLENIPPDYVDQILMHLRRSGLIESHRGAGGGYTLSRSPSQIRLGDIVRALEGRVFDAVCEKYDHGSKDCRHQTSCAISPVWKKLGDVIETYLDSITIAQLLDEKPSCLKAADLIAKIAV